ncbi:hypothetical protein BH11BAC2_BH11BAC2_08900 [soil metagenome]
MGEQNILVAGGEKNNAQHKKQDQSSSVLIKIGFKFHGLRCEVSYNGAFPLSAIKLIGVQKVTLFIKKLHVIPYSLISKSIFFGDLKKNYLYKMEYLPADLTIEGFLTKAGEKDTVLVDFFATWCEPCKYLDQILDELELRLGDKVSILKLDVDEQQQLKTEYTIMSVPTLMIFKNGKLMWRMPGYMLYPEMEAKVLEFCD